MTEDGDGEGSGVQWKGESMYILNPNPLHRVVQIGSRPTVPNTSPQRVAVCRSSHLLQCWAHLGRTTSLKSLPRGHKSAKGIDAMHMLTICNGRQMGGQESTSTSESLLKHSYTPFMHW